MTNSRRKGAKYELEVASIANGVTGLNVQRLLGQPRDGGCDLILPLRETWAVECKRRNRLTTMRRWFTQAEDGTPPGAKTMVVMRDDNGESLAVLRYTDFLELAR